jgi:hypothetical protein
VPVNPMCDPTGGQLGQVMRVVNWCDLVEDCSGLHINKLTPAHHQHPHVGSPVVAHMRQPWLLTAANPCSLWVAGTCCTRPVCQHAAAAVVVDHGHVLR